MAPCCGNILVRNLRRQLLPRVQPNVEAGVQRHACTIPDLTFSIFDDLIFYTALDSQVVGLDARTGELRWQSKVDSRGDSSGTIMAGDKVISGGSGCGTRARAATFQHSGLRRSGSLARVR